MKNTYFSSIQEINKSNIISLKYLKTWFIKSVRSQYLQYTLFRELALLFYIMSFPRVMGLFITY